LLAPSSVEYERRIVKRNLGFFVTVDSQAANNIVLDTYRHTTVQECSQHLLRQAFKMENQQL
jgi:ribonucleotide reductase beta subunit family protein with ferritin-like domain